MSTPYHPIVDEVVGHLLVAKENSLEGLQLSQEGAEQLRSRLQELSAHPDEFRWAVRDLIAFANHLHTVASPEAGDMIIELVASNPEVSRLASDATQQHVVEQREQVGDKFARFATVASAGETEIETDEPVVSALSLLKGRISG